MSTTKSTIRWKQPPLTATTTPPTARACSPRLRRSTSGTSTASLPSTPTSTSPHQSTTRPSRSATSSPRTSVHRTRTTTKTATKTTDKDKGKDKDKCNDDKTAKYPRSITPRNMAVKRVNSSPSAWALSPGRPSPLPPPGSPKLKVVMAGDGGKGGVGGVLKYFNSNYKQKKVSTILQEEELHRYRVVYNRLLQWRFANARAEASMATVKLKAEEKLFSVWIKVYKMRYGIAEKRMRVERLRQKIKLLEIILPQIELLNEWERLEKRNSEAVARITRKLSAISIKLPLVQGAKADTVSIYDTMSWAIEVMEDIETSITKFLFQAEKTCCLLRELMLTINGEQKECFEELEKAIAQVISLEARENSLRAQLMQVNKQESRDGHTNCKYHLVQSFGNRKINLLHSILNVS